MDSAAVHHPRGMKPIAQSSTRDDALRTRVPEDDRVETEPGTTMTPAQMETLRRLALGDPATARRVMGDDPVHPELLDAKTRDFVRVAAVVALDPTGPSFLAAVDAARAAGAVDDELCDVVSAVAEIIGSFRVEEALAILRESDTSAPPATGR